MTGGAASATALALAVLLSLLPGVAVLRVLVPHLGPARTLAAAPVVSAGTFYGLGQVLTLLRVPVDTTLAWTVLGLSAVALALSGRARRGRGSEAVLGRATVLAVVAGSVLSAVLWALVVGSTTAVPTHDDGYNHAFFVTRLLELRTLDPAQLFVAGPVDGPASAFYPLALHQQAAMVSLATGVDVGLALTLAALVPVVVGLPLGMALLTRRLLPEHPAVAVAVPLVVAVQPALMYSTSWWGGLTMAIGLALFPGFLDVLLRLTDELSPTAVVAAALALLGFAGLHTSEVVLLAVAATVLAAAQVQRPRTLPALTRRVGVLAVPFVASLVLLTPVLLQMAAVYGQVSEDKPGQVAAVGLGEAVARVALLQVGLPPTAPLAMALAAWLGVGLAASRGGSTARAWLALCAAVAAVTVWLWTWPGPVVNLLTSFWFSSAPRLLYVLVLFTIPFVAAGLVLPVQGLLRALQAGDGSLRPGAGRTAGAVLAAALGLLFVSTSLTATVQGGRQNYADFSLADRDARAAFAFLASHVEAEDRVLNQMQDGSPWMYSLAGVRPLIPVKSDRYGAPEWASTRWLLAEAASAHDDPRVAELLREHRIRYVYVSDRRFSGRPAELRREELQRSPAYRQVFQAGDAHVFAVVTTALAADRGPEAPTAALADGGAAAAAEAGPRATASVR